MVIKQSYYSKRKFRQEHKKDIRKKVVKAAVEDILFQTTKRLKKPVSEMMVLDVGSGTGEYSFELEKHVKKVVGVEPYKEAYIESIRNSKRRKSRVKFYCEPVEDFDSKSKFDVVISLTTIEHMPNAEKSFKKIKKLMCDNGLLYLTAPNKLWPYESHYDLFFLSWLPIPIANYYVRLFKKGSSYEDSSYSKTYWGMKRLFDELGYRYEFVVPSEGSEYIGCGKGGTFYKTIKIAGIRLIKRFPFLWAFSKGFIMIVVKN